MRKLQKGHTDQKKNPEVHLTCGVLDPRNVDTFLQIQGRAEFTTDRLERESFWDPHLANVFKGPHDPEYCVIRITPYRIEIWKEGYREPDVWEAQRHRDVPEAAESGGLRGRVLIY